MRVCVTGVFSDRRRVWLQSSSFLLPMLCFQQIHSGSQDQKRKASWPSIIRMKALFLYFTPLHGEIACPSFFDWLVGIGPTRPIGSHRAAAASDCLTPMLFSALMDVKKDFFLCSFLDWSVKNRHSHTLIPNDDSSFASPLKRLAKTFALCSFDRWKLSTCFNKVLLAAIRWSGVLPYSRAT